MAKKINLRKEKRLRNEAYADRFKKQKTSREEIIKAKEEKKQRQKWCRVKGHPITCEYNRCPDVNIGATPWYWKNVAA
jgi:hypothetical protein